MLATRGGRGVSRDEILDAIWGTDFLAEGVSAEMTDRHDSAIPGQHTASTRMRDHSSSARLKASENAMAIDHQVDRKVVTQEPTVSGGQETVQTDSRRVTRTGPGGTEMTRRIVIFVFGLIQLVIGARIVLLLLDAREANALVSGVLNVSQVFVAPFEGILRTDSLHSAGSTLDITAIVALVGVTIIELIVLWAVGIFRREPA